MLDTYRRILDRPGTALFSATGLVARLPIAMVGLGIVLLVEGQTDSYGFAGSVAAVAVFANAGFAILQGRWIDRLGQARVLPLAITVWGVALAGLMWSVRADRPASLTYVLAAVAGASLPSVGGCVRARWAHVLPDPAQRQTAFALEAVADETVFMTGPILVTVLATSVHPVAGLTSALVAGVGGTWALSAQRDTEPPPHPRTPDRSARPHMPWATVVPLTVVCLALGTLFGAAEVTTVAFSDELGARAYSGVLLALWAAGSLIAGAVTGAVSWRTGVERRLRWGAAAMALAMSPLAVIGSMWVMGPVLFVAGFAIAPTLIATMSLAEASVPSARLTEGMAFLQTGLMAGVAPGAALAGVVVDAYGASPAYLVSVGGGVVALAGALATRTPAATTSPAVVPAVQTTPPA